MNQHSRRNFFQTAGIAAAASLLTQSGQTFAGNTCCAKSACKSAFQYGLASYSTRKLSLDQTLQIMQRMNLKSISLKSFHLPMDSSADQIREVAKKIRDAGVTLYAGGVIDMRDQKEIDLAFEYAKTAGMGIIVTCTVPAVVKDIEKKIKEYNISVAIHNHGPDDKDFPTPLEAYALIKDMDPRFGLCMDLGHTVRSGVDPAEVIVTCKDRLLDFHFKDENKNTAEGSPLEVGRGVTDFPSVFRALQKIGYNKIAALEYEKDGMDPLPGIAESIGFLRGCQTALNA